MKRRVESHPLPRRSGWCRGGGGHVCRMSGRTGGSSTPTRCGEGLRGEGAPNQRTPIVTRAKDTVTLRAALLCLAVLPVLASCTATMTAVEFDRRFPSTDVPMTARMPPEDTDDTAAARAAAAQRHVEEFGLEPFFTVTVHEEAETLPASKRAAHLRAIHSALSADAMQAPMIDLMTKHFTRTQILALTQFEETPEGRSTMQKSGRQSGPIEPPEGRGDTLEDRRVATERLFIMMDFRRLYGDLARGAARRLPSETDRARVYGAMSDGYEKTRRDQVDQLTRYFTRREIDAMTRFYGSPVGQGVFVRMTLFQLDAMWLIMEQIRYAGSTLR
jgi:hypothetical protein